jgi:polyisoprenoid-binding protein YceI
MPSRFSVKAVASGMSAGLGHSPTIAIRDFDGEVCFVPGTLEAASLTVRVRADSLAVEDEMHAADRQELERIMRQQVLSTSRHPNVSYKSENAKVKRLGEGFYRVDLTGHLTLNGITRISSCQRSGIGRDIQSSRHRQLRNYPVKF